MIKNLKKFMPLIVIVSLYLMSKFYYDYTYKNKEIRSTLQYIKDGRGGKHFYYSNESYLVEDDYFLERNLNMLMLGDSIVKDKNSNTINVYRKVKHSYRLIFSLKYKERK